MNNQQEPLKYYWVFDEIHEWLPGKNKHIFISFFIKLSGRILSLDEKENYVKFELKADGETIVKEFELTKNPLLEVHPSCLSKLFYYL